MQWSQNYSLDKNNIGAKFAPDANASLLNMNNLVIPPSPNWYEYDVSACAPDNTLLYGSRNDLVIIQQTPVDQPNDVQIITKAHMSRLNSVNINKNWGNPNKLAVTYSEDKTVKLWDIKTLEQKLSHNKHITHEAVKGAAFAGDDRVVSVSENGIVVVWNIVHNETHTISSLFEPKTSITCLSICPHASWLAAFGLKTGLVMIVDLRKTGRILYKLRGHDKSVTSLTWCPVPINIFPIKPQNKVGLKRVTEEVEQTQLNSDCKKDAVEAAEIVDNRVEINVEKNIDKTVSPKKNDNPWVDLKFVDDSDQVEEVEDSQPSEADNFLKECRELKMQILRMASPEPTKTEVFYSPEGAPKVILKAKSKGKLTTVGKFTEIESADIDCDAPADNSSFDSAISSKTRNTDQSDHKSVDLNITDGSTNSTDLSVVSFHSVGEIFDNKNDEIGVDESENVDKSDSDDKNKTESNGDKEVHDIVDTLKKKFKDGKAVRDGDDSSAVSDIPAVLKREIPIDQSCEIEEPRKEFLLASSAKEGSIYIWRAGTDGRLQTFFTVPNSKQHGKKSYKAERIWITLCWVAPTILLSSSKSGELLQWNLPKPKDPTKQLRHVHKDHHGLIFNICAPVTLLNESTWLDSDRKLNVWTLGQDRLVINTDLGKEKTNLCCYPTFGAAITYFAASPVDPNRLAMGTHDGEIRIWDLSREHTKRIVFSRFHNRIQSRVTCLAWHPIVELSLAYGTMEGRIGILDTSNPSKSPKLLPDFFKNQIYKVEWGPKPDCKDCCLYAVSEGKVAIFDPRKDEKDPTLLDVPNHTIVYTFAWKPDYKMLLVSARSGALITYTADLNISHIYYLQEKLTSLVWHPDACSDETSASQYSKVFACVIKNHQCAVYDLGIESEQNDEKIIAKFDNAKDVLITSFAWSPHNENHLVIADEDGVAQVYDIKSKTVLATYFDPDFDNVLSIMWSSLDPNFIINGTVSKLVVWKVSDYPPLASEEITLKKKKFNKAQKKEQTEQISTESPQEVQTKESKPAKSTKSAVLPVFYTVRPETQCSDIRRMIDYKAGKSDIEPVVSDKKNVDVLTVFGKNSDMIDLINTNISTLRQRGKQINSNILTLWKGDISTEIKNAIEVKRINPQLIVMCAIFAPKFLQTACETYIEQLIDQPDSDPIDIVTYMLACHKVEDAIKLLCHSQLYKEAFALAKCRLPQDDPITLDVLKIWAKNSVYIGNFELAALCYVALGKFEDASSVLFRRSASELLQLSAELAEKSGNHELHKAVLFRLNAFKDYVENEAEAAEAVTSTDNDLPERPKCKMFNNVFEIVTNLESNMLPAVLVNELEHFKHYESQIFDRFIAEEHLYQLALASKGFLQKEVISEILRKSQSPDKRDSSPKMASEISIQEDAS